LEKVSIEAFADFFLRLFRIYGYALILTVLKIWNLFLVCGSVPTGLRAGNEMVSAIGEACYADVHAKNLSLARAARLRQRRATNAKIPH
jgi:hypothetical protein